MKSLLALLLTAVLPSFAEDWPQWRGPKRDGLSQEKNLLQEWPKDGPKLLWQVSDLGQGYSTPAVVGNRIYLMANDNMDAEFVQAHSTQDGKRLWRTRVGKVGTNVAQMNYAAARSTPTVDGSLLFALGSDGDLVCLEIEGGKIRWQKNLRSEFGGKPGDWAYAESPLVDGDAVICTPGGSQSTLLAVNKNSGKVLWPCALPEGDRASFASPIVVEMAGARQYVQLLEKGLVGVDAKTGKFLWRYAKPVSRFGANIPTPLAAEGLIYVGAAGTGGGAVRLKSSEGKIEAEQVYFESKLPFAIGGVVAVGDFIYGTTMQSMMGVELKTGKIKWEERALGAGSLCFADGRLYFHAESGEAALIEPSREGYREKGRFTPPGQPNRSKDREKAWTYPVVANGRLFLRDHAMLWSYDITAK